MQEWQSPPLLEGELEDLFIFFPLLGNALLFALLTQLEVIPKSLYKRGKGSLLTLWCPWLISLNRIPSLSFLPLDLLVLRPAT